MENKIRGNAKILAIVPCNIYLITSYCSEQCEEFFFFYGQNSEENVAIKVFVFSVYNHILN